MTNKVYHGDCLKILDDIPNESIDLIYLDPPFFTQKIHKLRTKDRNLEYRFSDVWESVSEYATFMQQRLEKMRCRLRSTGAIFFHCNRDSSHIARFLLDEIFGKHMFRSEIIWYYKRWSTTQNNLLPLHQTILFYSKTKDYKFNTELTDYSPTTNIDQILQKRKRDEFGKAIYARDNNGEVISGGIKKGVPLGDVWEIPFLNPKAKERNGYPTQKPILLLEKIIKLVTDEQDTVLDPFCGSGTTLAAATLLNRNAIGIDTSLDAVNLTRKILQSPVKTESNLLKKGIGAYQNLDENVLQQLEGLDIIPVQRNKGIDAFLNIEYKEVPIPIKVQKPNETISEAASLLYKTSLKKNAKLMLLIKTHEEKDLGLDVEFPKEIVIVDSTALSIQKILNRLNIGN
jgi:site-specific DNA-methyltransferase (adenine-specific)